MPASSVGQAVLCQFRLRVILRCFPAVSRVCYSFVLCSFCLPLMLGSVVERLLFAFCQLVRSVPACRDVFPRFFALACYLVVLPVAYLLVALVSAASVSGVHCVFNSRVPRSISPAGVSAPACCLAFCDVCPRFSCFLLLLGFGRCSCPRFLCRALFVPFARICHASPVYCPWQCACLCLVQARSVVFSVVFPCSCGSPAHGRCVCVFCFSATRPWVFCVGFSHVFLTGAWSLRSSMLLCCRRACLWSFCKSGLYFCPCLVAACSAAFVRGFPWLCHSPLHGSLRPCLLLLVTPRLVRNAKYWWGQAVHSGLRPAFRLPRIFTLRLGSVSLPSDRHIPPCSLAWDRLVHLSSAVPPPPRMCMGRFTSMWGRRVAGYEADVSPTGRHVAVRPLEQWSWTGRPICICQSWVARLVLVALSGRRLALLYLSLQFLQDLRGGSARVSWSWQQRGCCGISKEVLHLALKTPCPPHPLHSAVLMLFFTDQLRPAACTAVLMLFFDDQLQPGARSVVQMLFIVDQSQPGAHTADHVLFFTDQSQPGARAVVLMQFIVDQSQPGARNAVHVLFCTDQSQPGARAVVHVLFFTDQSQPGARTAGHGLFTSDQSHRLVLALLSRSQELFVTDWT